MIEFSSRPAYIYNIEDSDEDKFGEGNHNFEIIDLKQFNDNILIIIFEEENNSNLTNYNFYLYSNRKGYNKDNLIKFENFDFDSDSYLGDWDYITSMKNHYNIYLNNSDEIMIGILELYIINPSKWIIGNEIIFSDKLIENAFCLDNSYFLIYTRECLFGKNFKKEIKNAEILNNIKENNNILVARIGKNFSKIIYDSFLDFEEAKIYYNSFIDCNVYECNSKFILVKNNNISFYEFSI